MRRKRSPVLPSGPASPFPGMRSLPPLSTPGGIFTAQVFHAGRPAGSAAAGARLRVDPPLAAAGVTYDREIGSPVGHLLPALTGTGCTCTRLTGSILSRAPAGRAASVPLQGYTVCSAVDRIFEANRHIRLYVATGLRPDIEAEAKIVGAGACVKGASPGKLVCPPSGPSATGAEDLTEDVFQVETVASRAGRPCGIPVCSTVLRTAPEARVTLKARSPEHVVLFSLLRVGQGLVRLGDFLESVLRRLVPLIAIGVVLLGEALVGLLDFRLGSALRYAQNLIVVGVFHLCCVTFRGFAIPKKVSTIHARSR